MLFQVSATNLVCTASRTDSGMRVLEVKRHRVLGEFVDGC